MILHKSQHGFTLVEIMIVLVILGIVFAGMNYLSPGPRISRTNSERIATAVQDSIKSAQRDILIGRNPSSSIPITKKIVTISVGPTPRITTNYITADSQTGVESTLNYPFYDGDKKFQLRDISLFATRPSAGIEQVGGSFVSFTGLTNISIVFNTDRTIMLDSTDPAFVSAVNAGLITQSNIRYTMITTGYDAYEVKTRIDRVSGIIDALPMVQNTGTIITPLIYTWSASDYSPCTLSCGGGTQTRTTVCHDINELTVADSFCDIALKPELSQSCNTQSCPINGTCGAADSVPSSTLPNFGLCASGSGSTPLVNPAVPPAINDYWIWTCSGSNSGSSNNCSALKQTNYCMAGGVISCIASDSPILPIHAVCGITENTCIAGSPINDSGQVACGTNRTWTCQGSNGGGSTNCSLPNPVCSRYSGCDTDDILVGSYTLSACNIGSSIAGTGFVSYGNYFQWGRNKGFSYSDASQQSSAISGTIGLNAASDTYGFVWNSAFAGNTPWATTNINNNWGDLTNTLVARQGPCATGYHVPTIAEWDGVLNQNNFRSNISLMPSILKMPLAGVKYHISGSVVGVGIQGSYWTSQVSTLNVGSFNQLSIFTSGYNSPSNDYEPAVGLSVRCFKN